MFLFVRLSFERKSFGLKMFLSSRRCNVGELDGDQSVFPPPPHPSTAVVVAAAAAPSTSLFAFGAVLFCLSRAAAS